MENVLGSEWGMPPYFGSVSGGMLGLQLSEYLNYKLPGWRENITYLVSREVERFGSPFFRDRSDEWRSQIFKFTDVLSIVANYTSDYDVITTTSKTNLTKILKSFNSFDILITPHGVIANVMFSCVLTSL